MDVLVMITQVLLAILLAPLLEGISGQITCKFQSRRGSDVFQPYRNFVKLFKRSETLPENATTLFRIAPYLMFAVASALVAIVPVVYTDYRWGMVSDFFMFVYLAALLRFIFGAASLDSGSPFAAIGGSREQMLAVFVEPTLMLSAMVVAFLAKTTNLVEISNLVASGKIGYFIPAFTVAAVAFLWAVYVETGKKPFDLPEAEQELQEGLLSEYSGKRLAISQWALMIKRIAVIGLFVVLFAPWLKTGNPFLDFGIFFFKVGIFYIFTAFVDAFYSRYRLFQLKKTAAGPFSLAVLSLLLYVLGGIK